MSTLGAGSEVGRSCFLITIDDASVLVDTGLHMNPKGQQDRVPRIPEGVKILATIVTHYHLDHVGALAHLTEVSKDLLNCPEVLMTVPTKILSPHVLVDYCNGPNYDLFRPNHVWAAFARSSMTTIGLGEQRALKENAQFLVQSAYAGHVIGGVMLFLRYKGVCVVYTGDFSYVPDALLNKICIPWSHIPKSGVDVVISEGTHATTVTPVNKPLSAIYSGFCERISKALSRGGRVLIPIFAVGRTQEVASIIRRYLGSEVPLWTTSPAGHRASILSSTIHRQWLRDNEEFSDLGVSLLEAGSDGALLFPTGSVVFASPAMLEGGASLKLFSQVCDDPNSLVILTGYCSKNTVGNALILFASRPIMRTKTVNLGNVRRDVACECLYVPFSNHTDSVGIESVLRQLRPQHGLLLVHGEADKLERFKELMEKKQAVGGRIGIPRNYEMECFDVRTPDSGQTSPPAKHPLKLSKAILADSSLDALRDLIRERHSYYEVERVDDAITVSDSRCAIRVRELKDGRRGFNLFWEENRDRGPEWMTSNPLAQSIEFVLRTSGTLVENFSISSCSDR